jgi:hypothetical protein
MDKDNEDDKNGYAFQIESDGVPSASSKDNRRN